MKVELIGTSTVWILLMTFDASAHMKGIWAKTSKATRTTNTKRGLTQPIFRDDTPNPDYRWRAYEKFSVDWKLEFQLFWLSFGGIAACIQAHTSNRQHEAVESVDWIQTTSWPWRVCFSIIDHRNAWMYLFFFTVMDSYRVTSRRMKPIGRVTNEHFHRAINSSASNFKWTIGSVRMYNKIDK